MTARIEPHGQGSGGEAGSCSMAGSESVLDPGQSPQPMRSSLEGNSSAQAVSPGARFGRWFSAV